MAVHRADLGSENVKASRAERGAESGRGALKPWCSQSTTLSLGSGAGAGALKQGKEGHNKTHHGNCREQIGDYDEYMANCNDGQSVRILSWQNSSRNSTLQRLLRCAEVTRFL